MRGPHTDCLGKGIILLLLTGIIAAITYIVQGVLCIGAGKFVTGSYLPDLTEHFRVLKILNAVAVLMSSSLLGVTGYLVYVLSLWWAFYEEHLDYIKGPVLVRESFRKTHEKVSFVGH